MFDRSAPLPALARGSGMLVQMRPKLSTFAAAVSAVACVAACVLWVRSHVARDYAFTWLPWPADASGGSRVLKLDGDSGGGQVELSWKVWSTAERQQLSRRNSLAAENV